MQAFGENSGWQKKMVESSLRRSHGRPSDAPTSFGSAETTRSGLLPHQRANLLMCSMYIQFRSVYTFTFCDSCIQLLGDVFSFREMYFQGDVFSFQMCFYSSCTYILQGSLDVFSWDTVPPTRAHEWSGVGQRRCGHRALWSSSCDLLLLSWWDCYGSSTTSDVLWILISGEKTCDVVSDCVLYCPDTLPLMVRKVRRLRSRVCTGCRTGYTTSVLYLFFRHLG